MAAPTDNAAIAALVLGILSCLCCPILGPIAVALGNQSRQRIASSRGAVSGLGLAVAGLVLGIIGSVFLALGIVYILIVILGVLVAHATG